MQRDALDLIVAFAAGVAAGFLLCITVAHYRAPGPAPEQ